MSFPIKSFASWTGNEKIALFDDRPRNRAIKLQDILDNAGGTGGLYGGSGDIPKGTTGKFLGAGGFELASNIPLNVYVPGNQGNPALQFVNDGTGTGVNSGLQLGLRSTGEAYINQHLNAKLTLSTNNNPVLILQKNGDIQLPAYPNSRDDSQGGAVQQLNILATDPQGNLISFPTTGGGVGLNGIFDTKNKDKSIPADQTAILTDYLKLQDRTANPSYIQFGELSNTQIQQSMVLDRSSALLWDVQQDQINLQFKFGNSGTLQNILRYIEDGTTPVLQLIEPRTNGQIRVSVNGPTAGTLVDALQVEDSEIHTLIPVEMDKELRVENRAGTKTPGLVDQILRSQGPGKPPIWDNEGVSFWISEGVTLGNWDHAADGRTAPGTGEYRLDQSPQPTKIYVNYTDKAGDDQSQLLAAVSPGNELLVTGITRPNDILRIVIDSATDQGTYYEYDIRTIKQGGANTGTLSGEYALTLKLIIVSNEPGNLIREASDGGAVLLPEDIQIADWQATTNYPAGTYVQNNGRLYVSAQDHTSTANFDTDLQGGNWDRLTGYVATQDDNDQSILSPVLYMDGVNPRTPTKDGEVANKKYVDEHAGIGTYSDTGVYLKGALVRFQNLIWEANKALDYSGGATDFTFNEDWDLLDGFGSDYIEFSGENNQVTQGSWYELTQEIKRPGTYIVYYRFFDSVNSASQVISLRVTLASGEKDLKVLGAAGEPIFTKARVYRNGQNVFLAVQAGEDATIEKRTARIEALSAPGGASATKLRLDLPEQTQFASVLAEADINQGSLLSADQNNFLIIGTDGGLYYNPTANSGLGVWTFNVANTSPPASGEFRLQSAGVPATSLYIHNINQAGEDKTADLQNLQAGQSLVFTSTVNTNSKLEVKINSILTDPAYTEILIDSVSDQTLAGSLVGDYTVEVKSEFTVISQDNDNLLVEGSDEGALLTPDLVKGHYFGIYKQAGSSFQINTAVTWDLANQEWKVATSDTLDNCADGLVDWVDPNDSERFRVLAHGVTEAPANFNSKEIYLTDTPGSYQTGQVPALLDATYVQRLFSQLTPSLLYFNPSDPKVNGGGGGTGGSGIATWTQNTQYTAGEYVRHKGTIYLASAGFTSGLTFDPINWTILNGYLHTGTQAEGTPSTQALQERVVYMQPSSPRDPLNYQPPKPFVPPAGNQIAIQATTRSDASQCDPTKFSFFLGSANSLVDFAGINVGDRIIYNGSDPNTGWSYSLEVVDKAVTGNIKVTPDKAWDPATGDPVACPDIDSVTLGNVQIQGTPSQEPNSLIVAGLASGPAGAGEYTVGLDTAATAGRDTGTLGWAAGDALQLLSAMGPTENYYVIKQVTATDEIIIDLTLGEPANLTPADQDRLVKVGTAPPLPTPPGPRVPTADAEIVNKEYVDLQVEKGSAPIGMIIAYPSLTPPAGYLLCNGDPIPADTQYDALRALIGANTPDLVDQFIRGAGTQQQITGFTKHQDTTRRPRNNFTIHGSGNTSSNGNHRHSFTRHGYNTDGGWSGGDALWTVTKGPSYSVSTNTTGNHHHSVSINGTVNGGGDSETAPQHVRLAFMIKAV